MAKSIDWYYRRNSCDACGRSDAWLAKRGVAARETVDARKVRYGANELAALFRGAKRLRVARGKKLIEIDLASSPSAETLAQALGPTGNLRAPAARVGDAFVAGFDERAWGELVG